MNHFPHYKQPDSRDFGPTCLRMVAKHYGRNYTVFTCIIKVNYVLDLYE
ncbi:MAG: cysteine peptidase family C39 domain-containing protein [Bacteroidales bacterium]|nr:cysteine peptidase family C39 domain-containing protein [Bacteroidales bacterium]